MELRDALSQIEEIRRQMARGEIFRGYRSATTAFSGIVAVVAAIVQASMIRDPDRHAMAFILLWISAAAVSLAVVAAEMVVRTRRSHSPSQRQLPLLAVEQFMPSVAAGALLTYVMCDFLPQAIVLLPGLWMILFSMGMFASSRLLPRAVFGVAGFYLIAGVIAMVAASRGLAFSPWLMGGAFGLGQFMTAAILYVRLEKRP